MNTDAKVALIIPCYKVKRHIVEVLQAIGSEVSQIYVIDDCCPEESGKYVKSQVKDQRITVLTHQKNTGVGGALLTGYRQAIKDKMTIAIKVDGDGQMDTNLIPRFIAPILAGKADYTKGNRFYELESLSTMPKLRLFGNALLSFINKLASGYWSVMDPTNGFTAIHIKVLQLLPLDKIEKRYFFESDMLFRLNIVRALVLDIPMVARYGNEASNLKISSVVISFPAKFLVRFFKRIFYNYFLRDFTAGSVEILSGLFFLTGGAIYGISQWYTSFINHIVTPSGSVMLAALPVLIGFQFLIAALNYDVYNSPKLCLHELLE